ncbi:hypothetical protein PNOK_0829900 [Pyrrhoderma noxium]|uniref:DUF6534 domain-containing protein n=1 Tax=Pyrrhoderma noxium TaxID=2282107 RepID=A0A286UAT6_9AGAM|nr:hypothetical protein PNOK_0829900 [Pyrrhoderma noxium]
MSGSAKDLYDSIGSLYLGNAITMSLWGIATLQMYYYYNRYLKDALWIKLLVFLIWTLDTVHQALILKVGYTYVVTDYDNPKLLGNTGVAVPILTSSGPLVELAKTFNLRTFAELKPYIWIVKLCISLIAVTDTSIAVTLIVLLHRSKTGFEKSDNIINRLIVFTVNTGAIPSFLSLLIIVIMEIYPNNLIWKSTYIVYTNTLFATLNARDYGAEMLHSTVPNNILGIRKATNNDMLMAIQVDTTISHKTDDIRLDGLKTEVSEPKAASVDLV